MRWLWTISWTIVSLCALALFLVLVFFSTIDSNPIPANFGALLDQRYSVAQSACHPDGAFSPFQNTYRWWSLEGFFQVTLAFGELTFTQVKLIDIAWGIVSGPQSLSIFPPWACIADWSLVCRSSRSSHCWIPLLESVCGLPHNLHGDHPGHIHYLLATVPPP